MKLFQLILILLILCTSYPANASKDTNSYDGNIFPIYAGNGAIVPPQTTLEESLKNQRVSVLFFYLDDSSDSKACLLYTSPSPRDLSTSRMPSSA